MIEPAGRPHSRPLTHGQRLIWLGQRLHPRTPLYNMVLIFDIGGAVEPRRFERAFRAVVEGSDALRSVLHDGDDDPRWRDAPVGEHVVDHVDLSGEDDADGALDDLVRTRARAMLDPRERLYDCALIRLSDDRWIWYLCQHHLVTDGWSAALVYRAVAESYGRVAGDREAKPLPAHAALIAHERAVRESPAFARIEAHWKERAAAIEPIRLYGRPALRDGTATERVTRDLGPDRSARLRALAAERSVGLLDRNVATLNVFATTLFAWLHRVSGQTRLTIGAPSHNRPSVAFRRTIGLFIEVFPLGIEIDDDETFDSLYGKVRAETAAFLRHAQPGTSTADVNRAFNVLLNYIHASFPPFAGQPVMSEWLHPGHGDAAHQLRLQVHDFDEAGRFVLHFDVDAETFEAGARAAAADHFVHLLDAFVEDPARRIAEAPLVPASAARTLTTSVPADAPHTVVDLFDAQARRTPDAVAVRDGDERTTYAELHARAKRLAARLRARGAGPDTLVGLHARRSADAVAGILGVLAAGAAYVPLPPEDPPARLRAIVDDAGTTVVLTDDPAVWGATFDGAATPCTLSLRDDAIAAGGETTDARPSLRDAAYVLYTSGSTGAPKGVVIEHEALAAYVTWAAATYGGGAAVSMPLFTSLAFDLTVTSLFVPLVTGGAVHVYRDDGGGSAALLDVIEDDAVDAIKLTPAHLSLLRGRTRTNSRVRSLIVGGEELRTDVAWDALRAFGDVAIFNEYGPTEATVGCMIHRFDAACDTGPTVPIGGPAARARIALLDAGGNPLPAGVLGEICVGGPGLARGYHGRPDLTAARFVPDAFEPGKRLYRTGDLGLMRADGVMEYHGRADRQVKVGGVRIEPGEVEAAMRSHGGVRDAVVETFRATRGARTPDRLCARCGLPSTYPGARYDDAGICHLCRGFDAYRDRVRLYFRTMPDLEARLAEARSRRRGEFDCLVLLSGGKDSTYALGRVVELGARVMSFTLDNGYLSEEAKVNIRRVTEQLGVPHVFGTTDAMNAIFVDSLERHGNVCNGCFKTLYTLGARLARSKGIPLVMTGLSRGQFFETRLTEELFLGDASGIDRIDPIVLEARKAYHRVPDAVADLLDTRDFADDALFDEVEFIDFYRYCDVTLDDMLAWLARNVPWIRPSDTGRSTNCRINQVGIFVHQQERGFHNYALPYSWDVRMGHKERDAALAELDDEINVDEVRRILGEIGYEGPAAAGLKDGGAAELVGYWVGDAVDDATLRAHLATRLPRSMVPRRFVQLDEIPLTSNGKVDRSALPRPDVRRVALPIAFQGPRSPLEERIVAIWCEVLEVDRVGIDDAFLDLGGNSLLAIQIISRLNHAFDVDLPLRSAFEASTVTALARLVEHALVAQIEAMSEDEAVRLAGDRR